MALLDKLWDDTLARPQLENGLSKLKKPVSRPSLAKANRVTRNIMIVKPPPNNNDTSKNENIPSSPGWNDASGARRFQRRFSLDEYERSGILVWGALNRDNF
ncbi:hypothetical protein AMTRI_Chr01g127760 [Amborella trichopoda]